MISVDKLTRQTETHGKPCFAHTSPSISALSHLKCTNEPGAHSRTTRTCTHLHALGARLEARLVGISHFVVHPSASGPDVCFLQDLFTAPNARGEGVGRALIVTVSGSARERVVGVSTGLLTSRTPQRETCMTGWLRTAASSTTRSSCQGDDSPCVIAGASRTPGPGSVASLPERCDSR
jgi:hypothetical protein